MKTKYGFISNSSTTSFIVAVKKMDCITQAIIFGVSNYTQIDREENLLKYYNQKLEDISCLVDLDLKKEQDILKAECEKCLAAIRKGKTIYFGDCDPCGEGMDILLTYGQWEMFNIHPQVELEVIKDCDFMTNGL